jgi:hypothetical protein
MNDVRSLLVSQIKDANQYESKTNKAIALLALQLIKVNVEANLWSFYGN